MPATSRNVWTTLLVILGIVVAGAIVVAWTTFSGMMRLPTSESIGQIASAKTGTLEIVIEISAVDARGHIRGVLLARGGSTATYVRTKTPVQVKSSGPTRFVMGSQADLIRGAVIDVQGTRVSTEPLTIDGDRIVVLTGNVSVK